MSDAQKIDDVKVVAGRLIRVQNTNRPTFSNSKDEYFSIWVEDADGKNERCLMFTERELKVGEIRANKNKEDWPKKSLLTNLLD